MTDLVPAVPPATVGPYVPKVLELVHSSTDSILSNASFTTAGTPTSMAAACLPAPAAEPRRENDQAVQRKRRKSGPLVRCASATAVGLRRTPSTTLPTIPDAPVVATELPALPKPTRLKASRSESELSRVKPDGAFVLRLKAQQSATAALTITGVKAPFETPLPSPSPAATNDSFAAPAIVKPVISTHNRAESLAAAANAQGAADASFMTPMVPQTPALFQLSAVPPAVGSRLHLGPRGPSPMGSRRMLAGQPGTGTTKGASDVPVAASTHMSFAEFRGQDRLPQSERMRLVALALSSAHEDVITTRDQFPFVQMALAVPPAASRGRDTLRIASILFGSGRRHAAAAAAAAAGRSAEASTLVNFSSSPSAEEAVAADLASGAIAAAASAAAARANGGSLSNLFGGSGRSSSQNSLNSNNARGNALSFENLRDKKQRLVATFNRQRKRKAPRTSAIHLLQLHLTDHQTSQAHHIVEELPAKALLYGPRLAEARHCLLRAMTSGMESLCIALFEKGIVANMNHPALGVYNPLMPLVRPLETASSRTANSGRSGTATLVNTITGSSIRQNTVPASALVETAVAEGPQPAPSAFVSPSWLLLAMSLGLDNFVRVMMEQHRVDTSYAWYGLSYVHVACAKGQTGILSKLLQAGASPVAPSLSYARFGRLRALKAPFSRYIQLQHAANAPFLAPMRELQLQVQPATDARLGVLSEGLRAESLHPGVSTTETVLSIPARYIVGGRGSSDSAPMPSSLPVGSSSNCQLPAGDSMPLLNHPPRSVDSSLAKPVDGSASTSSSKGVADSRGSASSDAVFVVPVHGAASCPSGLDRTPNTGNALANVGRPQEMEHAAAVNPAAVVATAASAQRGFASHLVFPIDFALMNGHVSAARLLVQKCHAVVATQSNFALLAPALALPEHQSLALQLLALGCSSSTRSPLGQTPLHAASRAGNLELVVALVLFGATVNAQDACGWTPLHEALARRHTAVAEYLLAKGASLTVTAFNCGRTPLQIGESAGVPEPALERLPLLSQPANNRRSMTLQCELDVQARIRSAASDLLAASTHAHALVEPAASLIVGSAATSSFTGSGRRSSRVDGHSGTQPSRRSVDVRSLSCQIPTASLPVSAAAVAEALLSPPALSTLDSIKAPNVDESQPETLVDSPQSKGVSPRPGTAAVRATSGRSFLGRLRKRPVSGVPAPAASTPLPLEASPPPSPLAAVPTDVEALIQTDARPADAPESVRPSRFSTLFKTKSLLRS